MNLRNPWLLLVLVLGLAVVVQLVLPWWSMAAVAFGVGFGLARTGRAAFWAGFGGAGLSWLLPAAWLSHQNNGLLAQRVAQLLPLGGSAGALVVVAGVVAGLVGGLAALAGVWTRQALRSAPQPHQPG
ncbi:MAG TPA: hypothetical protein VF690_01815 [Hymenobacter sp.]